MTALIPTGEYWIIKTKTAEELKERLDELSRASWFGPSADTIKRAYDMCSGIYAAERIKVLDFDTGRTGRDRFMIDGSPILNSAIKEKISPEDALGKYDEYFV